MVIIYNTSELEVEIMCDVCKTQPDVVNYRENEFGEAVIYITPCKCIYKTEKAQSNTVVPFEEDKIKAYLDKAIIHWREYYKDALGEQEELIASCYVDAFQSVRISLFGETLHGDVIGNIKE